LASRRSVGVIGVRDHGLDSGNFTQQSALGGEPPTADLPGTLEVASVEQRIRSLLVDPERITNCAQPSKDVAAGLRLRGMGGLSGFEHVEISSYRIK
jgi:hypothetical protein